MPFAKKKDTRTNALAVLLAVIIVIAGLRMGDLSIIEASKYAGEDGITTRTAVLKAPRGEILDNAGREIAVNRGVFVKPVFFVKKMLFHCFDHSFGVDVDLSA